MYRRQQRGRASLLIVLGACWAIGLIGLDGGRTVSLQLLGVLGLVGVFVWIAGAVRRTVAPRERFRMPSRVESRNCIVIRPLGSDEHPAGRG